MPQRIKKILLIIAFFVILSVMIALGTIVIVVSVITLTIAFIFSKIIQKKSYKAFMEKHLGNKKSGAAKNDIFGKEKIIDAEYEIIKKDDK